MSTEAIRRMSLAKASVIIFVAVALLTTAFMLKISQGEAAAPTPIPGVPHYFGPYANWANSPLTSPDVKVAIDAPNPGPGITAEASATIGANGAVTGFTITNPGSGYTADAVVTITKADGTAALNPASAVAKYAASGVVTSVSVGTPGAKYTKPNVVFGAVTPGGATTQATGTAFGGVDGLTITNLGSVAGYHLPTVSFDMPDDPNGTIAEGRVICPTMTNGQCVNPNPGGTLGVVTITGIEVTNPGSGYSAAPGVAIIDGTQFEPAPSQPGDPLLVPAVVASTISVDSVRVDTFGVGYTSAPDVDIQDAGGTPTTPAVATAVTTAGAITSIQLTNAGGSGYMTPGGIKKFTDTLPGLCNPGAAAGTIPACPNWTTTPTAPKAIPLAVPTAVDYTNPLKNNRTETADQYEIGLVQYRTSFSSSLPAAGTLVRGYVQIDPIGAGGGVPGSQDFPLTNTVKDPANPGQYKQVPVLINDLQAYGVTAPQWLGPTIAASRDRAVRIVFRNLLPTGSDGDLFLPTDSTIMGSGMAPGSSEWTAPTGDSGTVLDGIRNPMCTDGVNAVRKECFTQNRATLHLHGGVTPWISDGTPHQWITPANEQTDYPEGVSVQNVPDMKDGNGNVIGDSPTDGVQTFYYTNQQSARLMFYHDHAWGITRLNVYAGEAAGYLLTDTAETNLMSGALAGLGLGTPLVIQDRTFVPDAAQLALQDPTWDPARWGGKGSFWYHHVYMPAQNPGDPSGMSAFGRWMYGPWFWPPASPQYPPIANPYYDAACDLNNPSTYQYTTDPFCEPKLIPSTPNISAGMEQFNDTPVVNGVAYPDTTVPKGAVRFRILNAANDRFWNLQWYVADSTGTEVALKAAEVAAAQTDPNLFPTPDLALSPAGPDWVQIGNEGGFLPAPVVVDGQQVTTWIIDPTRFDVGNVDKHSLLLAPAERADVIVDFSAFATGTQLILYNDAPAAFPARVASYDYYTGGPDLTPVGAPSTLPGYGPNTRTIMRVTVGSAGTPLNMTALNTAFRHSASGTGVFESSQDPIIVGQAAYNSAYGTNFVSSGWCNVPGATGTAATRCDGFARIQEGNHPTDLFGFNSLLTKFRPGNGKVQIPFQPKGMHDEMNATAFDEFGRMQANLGLEAPNANPLLQNIILYPYVNPSTELIDATNLPTGDVKVTPIAITDDPSTPNIVEGDGSQIWKITHNGVDTHPIHFHLWNVQVINRVTWDNIIIPPDPAELGWKETVRVSPLQDTIVALRPVVPTVPFEVPNSVRDLNPMAPEGWETHDNTPNGPPLFNNIDANGNPTANIRNDLVNLGWEYVYHCHILSHEEMDMMRPVMVMLPPNKADTLVATVNTNGASAFSVHLAWNDNSINETAFVVQRSTDGTTWTPVGTVPQPLKQSLPTGHGGQQIDDSTVQQDQVYQYRVVAENKVGYLGAAGAFMSYTVKSFSAPVTVTVPVATPTTLTATYQAGTGSATWLPPRVLLSWTDNSTVETGFNIERSTDGGATWTQIATPATKPANAGPTATFTDTGPGGQLSPNTTYTYRVAAVGAITGPSAWSNLAAATTPNFPLAPTIATIVGNRVGNSPNDRVTLTWNNLTNETGYTVQWSTSPTFATVTGSSNVGANVTTFTTGNVPRFTTFYFRVRASNAAGASPWSATRSVLTP